MKARHYGAVFGGVSYLTHLVPLALVLYGVWLGLRAHIAWGFLLLVTFPAWALVGWTEILFGWNWVSPMWPFAIAGVLEVAMFLLGLAVSAWLQRDG